MEEEKIGMSFELSPSMLDGGYGDENGILINPCEMRELNYNFVTSNPLPNCGDYSSKNMNTV